VVKRQQEMEVRRACSGGGRCDRGKSSELADVCANERRTILSFTCVCVVQRMRAVSNATRKKLCRRVAPKEHWRSVSTGEVT
jgi:hypothetical protein